MLKLKNLKGCSHLSVTQKIKEWKVEEPILPLFKCTRKTRSTVIVEQFIKLKIGIDEFYNIFVKNQESEKLKSSEIADLNNKITLLKGKPIYCNVKSHPHEAHYADLVYMLANYPVSKIPELLPLHLREYFCLKQK